MGGRDIAWEHVIYDPAETTFTPSTTGGVKGEKLARFSDFPPDVMRELAEHCGKGAAKYPDVNGAPNWRLGYEWSKSYSALQRHLHQFWSGEDIDEETGSKHIIAAMWHCMVLSAWSNDERLKEEFDDRVV